MTETVKQILKEHGHLSKDVGEISVEDDLYQLGLTSHGSVNVMLALEGAFDIEFPDQMLKRGTFESVAAICEAIEELKG